MPPAPKPSLRALALALLALRARAVELWVGARDLTAASNVRLWALDAANGTSSWADGLSVGFPPLFAPADLAALSAAGMRLVPCVHSSLDTMQRQLLQNDDAPASANTSEFVGAYTGVLPAFRAGTAAGPGPFMWWSLTEDDSSGVGFPFEQLAVPPSSHADAWAQFDNYLQRAQVLSAVLAPGTPLVAQVGFAEQAHAHFARGATLAVVERANDDIGDLSTALAFARGGARQFGAAFGVDLSWWWGVLYSGVNRLPGAYHRRHAFLSLYAGASVVNVEGGDGLCDGDGKPLPLGAEVQAFGEFLRSHGLAGGVSPAAAAPIVPVLVVLPKDHGYSTRPYWLTRNEAFGYARLPPRVGDRAIGGFFSFVFSGAGFSQDPWPLGAFASNDPPASMWALSALTAPYAPRLSDVVQAAPYIPFGRFDNRTAAAAAFAAAGTDPSPWRPMADSRFGGIFDVAVAGLGLASGTLSAAPNNVFGASRRRGPSATGAGTGPRNSAAAAGGDADGDAPLPLGPGSGYRVALVLGPVNMTATLRAQLLNFAQRGGHVIVAAGVVGPADGELTGLPLMLPELRVGRAWRLAAPAPLPPVPQTREAFRFVPVQFEGGAPPANVTVIASTAAAFAACGGAPCPLATNFAVGAGIVTTVLIPWFEGGDRDGLSALAEGVFEHAFAAVAPLSVSWADDEGFPVDFLAAASRAAATFTAVVSNNDEANWRGNVTLAGPDAPQSIANCAELRSGARVVVADGTAMDVRVGGFDVAVVQCDAVWGRPSH